jgi:multiple sugar transport system ATP-binding protein
VTHDQIEAMTLADRIVVLNAGRIEQVGTPLELYNSPSNAFVAGFIGSPRMNFLPAVVISDDGTLRLTVGEREVALSRAASGLAAGAGVTLGIRPEHIDVAPDTGMLTAAVDLVEQLGGETFIYASAPGLSQITLRQDGQSQFHRGDPVAIRFAPEHLHIFDATGAALVRP